MARRQLLESEIKPAFFFMKETCMIRTEPMGPFLGQQVYQPNGMRVKANGPLVLIRPTEIEALEAGIEWLKEGIAQMQAELEHRGNTLSELEADLLDARDEAKLDPQPEVQPSGSQPEAQPEVQPEWDPETEDDGEPQPPAAPGAPVDSSACLVRGAW